MAHVEALRREGERIDLMFKFAKAASAAVYGKEGVDLMNDTTREFLARVSDVPHDVPHDVSSGAGPAAIVPDNAAYMAALKAEYVANEALNAGYDERMAAHAVVVYVPPPVGSLLTPETR